MCWLSIYFGIFSPPLLQVASVDLEVRTRYATPVDLVVGASSPEIRTWFSSSSPPPSSIIGPFEYSLLWFGIISMSRSVLHDLKLMRAMVKSVNRELVFISFWISLICFKISLNLTLLCSVIISAMIIFILKVGHCMSYQLSYQTKGCCQTERAIICVVSVEMADSYLVVAFVQGHST